MLRRSDWVAVFCVVPLEKFDLDLEPIRKSRRFFRCDLRFGSRFVLRTLLVTLVVPGTHVSLTSAASRVVSSYSERHRNTDRSEESRWLSVSFQYKICVEISVRGMSSTELY